MATKKKKSNPKVTVIFDHTTDDPKIVDVKRTFRIGCPRKLKGT